MRKTLIAMLGLVAVALWALPVLAANRGPDLQDGPKAHAPISLDNRAGYAQRMAGGKYQGTLSGTLVKNGTPTTTWFLYPGACFDRYANTWTGRTHPAFGMQADSLNGYTAATTGPYTAVDLSLSEPLWHIADSTTTDQDELPFSNVTPLSLPDTYPGAMQDGRALWCGKYDAAWANKVGYPNLTYQILYMDTGTHAGNYTLTFQHDISTEYNYDFFSLVGGGNNDVDPILNLRSKLDTIIADGHGGASPPESNQSLLVQWTGSIMGGTTASTVGGAVTVLGNGAGDPETGVTSLTIDAQHRALYWVFLADCLFSSEDGLWPDGHGMILDKVASSDNGSIYDNQAVLLDSGNRVYETIIPANGGIVLVGTITGTNAGTATVAARVAPGAGQLWKLVQGSLLPTEDVCTPKNSSADMIFMGARADYHTIPGQYNAVQTCTFPIPTGTASVWTQWNEYLDLPRLQGYVQQSEFRYFKDGGWSNWENTAPGGGVRTGALKAWVADGDELAAATQADSVQVRFDLQCITAFAADRRNCGDIIYGILYDDFRLEVVTGTPAPIFGVFVGSVGQSMFVDGTMTGDNCSTPPCWPGPRGTENGNSSAVSDNFNSPLGDSVTLAVVTGLRKGGQGINWHKAFNKGINAGLTIAHTNPNFVAAYDAPRMIFRMYDPATTTWSPWDSSELDVNAFQVSAGDTVMIDSEYRVNWPPRDKQGGATLPGGFTINGNSAYDAIAFMPRGTRLQYYWKGVDLNGGTSYQFSTDALAREVWAAGDPDAPVLPGSSIVAPDIIQFEVLPGVYPTGTSGTLIAGKKDTPLLDLDGTYTRWSYGSHATTQILRALGVRFDRYRTLQGLEEGAHIGGHELAGTRQGRLSNYFPNTDEYGLADSLKKWYTIMIESGHNATSLVDEAQDCKILKQWWEAPTEGTYAPDATTNGGDRCLFASGDNYFNLLLAHAATPTAAEVITNDFASSVFGVATATDQTIVTTGANSTQFPNVRDRFADPAAGPALGTAGAYVYVVDGGCPAPNRFDALTPVAGGEATATATYNNIASPPTKTDNAAVAYMTDVEDPDDNDRNKSLGYGFSIQYIRQGGASVPPITSGENLVDTRAQVLYKFLTSCRGPRTSEPSVCWPCPTDANKYANWATSSAFSIATYGPLYPIQDGTKVITGVDGGGTAAAPAANRLQGSFPNPFNPETAVRFTAASSGRVEVRIFDVAGRLVQTLSKNVTAGVNEVRWNGKSKDGSNLASGIYFIKVRYPDGTEDALGHKTAIIR